MDDVSFTIERGETLSLVGESGCGKTTTSRCILRAIAPTAGQIRFHTESGAEIDVARLARKELRPLRRQMQMIFQDPFSSLNPRMTIAEIIGEPLLVNGMGDTRARNAGLPSCWSSCNCRRLHEPLSACVLRRPAPAHRHRPGARAEPGAIVADEPVSALDVSVQAQIVNLMLELQDRLGNRLSVRRARPFGGEACQPPGGGDVCRQDRRGRPDRRVVRHAAASLHRGVAVGRPGAGPSPACQADRAQGDVADPSDPPPGCAFHPRCRYAIERCRQAVPELEEVAPGHAVRCLRAKELALLGVAAEHGVH